MIALVRRAAVVLALLITAVSVGAGVSSATTVATQAAPIGPECAENVRAAVLAAVAGRVSPGQIIQYLQITADGQLQLCTVTVPGAG